MWDTCFPVKRTFKCPQTMQISMFAWRTTVDNQWYAQCWVFECLGGLTIPVHTKTCRTSVTARALCMKQLFCVGLRNVIALHILKPARVSGEQIIAYRPQHQTSFCFIISSQTPLPTSPLNRPRSQRSWLSHLSILNVPASAGCRFILTSTTVVHHPKMCFHHISLRWIKA